MIERASSVINQSIARMNIRLGRDFFVDDVVSDNEPMTT